MKKRPVPKLQKVAGLSEIKEGESKKFLVKRLDRKTEAFLILKNGEPIAYLNLCRHWTVGLDFDDNDFFSEDKKWLVCKNHGAVYDPITGKCDSGPCGGAALYKVPLRVKGGFIYAVLDQIDWGEL